MSKGRKTLGVGVVGLGVGEQHARAYAKDRRCRLRWLYDISAKQTKSVRKRVGAGGIAKSFEQILRDDDVDLVSIASFDHLHFAGVKAAFAAGQVYERVAYFDRAAEAYERMLSLPLYTRMTDADVQRVAQAVRAALA